VFINNSLYIDLKAGSIRLSLRTTQIAHMNIKDRQNNKLKNLKSHKALMSVTLVFIFITMVLTWWGLLYIKERTLQETQDKLSTVLNTTAEALNFWVSDQLQRSHNIASDANFALLTAALIKQYKNGGKLLGSSSLQQIRQFLLTSETAKPDFHIILPNGINLASQRDVDLESLNVVYRYRPKIFQHILKGKGQFIPPVPSDIALGEQKIIAGLTVPPTLFMAVPIKSSSGKVIAVFAQRFDPEQSLSRITALGQLGESGVTYAFDEEAQLLTSSRFEDKFFDRGFIAINEQTPLALEIRDPGKRLDNFIDISLQHFDKPLTVMAANAIAGFTSSDMAGYRDYRGEWVVGSWTWLKELNIGLTTEIDREEALGLYNTTRNIVILIMLTLMLLVAIYLLIVIKTNKKIELSLIKSRDELEDKVNGLTAELLESQSKLIITKELADQASHSKSAFLSSMSHEIRTPINGVMGMLGLLLNSSLTPEQKHKAEVANSSAKSLLNIINDILDFSKVEAGEVKLENIDFNIEILIDSVVKAMAFSAEEKDIELILDASKISNKMVKGDPQRLRQIISNLIGNAIKFTRQGTIIVRLSTTHYKESILTSCSITDTGIGIPADRIDTLFDSFSQVDNSSTREYSGSGLGLAICKKLIILMNGDIDVESSLNKGSVFSFNLSFDISNKKIDLLVHENIKSKNILIIDDNLINREIFSAQIKNWGGNIFEAESGAAGIKMCDQFTDSKLDFIIIDMQMPHMDGIQFTKIIRANAKYKDIKIIMMTSINQQQSAAELRAIGLNGWFTKPVSSIDLHNSLLVASAQNTLENTTESTSELITSAYLQSINIDQNTLNEVNIPQYWPEYCRILLVEDNVINQVVAEGILETIGLTCDIVQNGSEALTRLKESSEDNPYTIILMDCKMPIMDGYEATKRIREGVAGEKYSNITIIALTANAMTGDKENCLEIGMNDYISKPIDTNVLLALLKKWIAPAD
jgi:signal transduction histidine kinase/DNA-binding response OmpR family regulator